MPTVRSDAEDTSNSNPIMPEAGAEEWRKRAEELFKGLPPPSIKSSTSLFQPPDISKFKNQLGYTPAEAWQKCAAAAENYDAVTCKAYREEIDTLLVFAGLFSAVVTAFTIESYQWLQNDPNDTIIALLSQLAQPGNLTQTTPAPAGLADAISARINAYWFLSLTLSLAAALVAILCKQWVREFERRGDQSPNVYIGVRQTKWEGFEAWGVPSVVSAVPLLLQSALGLFALGLIELLWELHRTVALVVLVPSVATLSFYTATTLLPGLQIICSPFRRLYMVSQCPFKSPQALLALRLQALLWESFCFVCFQLFPVAVYAAFEFGYRKCLVFCRRVYASFQALFLPNGDGPQDAIHRWSQYLWRCRHILSEMLSPWRRYETAFYASSLDRPSWSRFVQWWHTHLPFLPHSRWPQSPTLERDSIGHAWSLSMTPEFRRSWVTLDRNLTAFRDGERLVGHGHSSHRVVVRSCFRGLAWLLNQTDQPGLPQWIWLAIWDIAAGPYAWTDESRAHILWGIHHLMRNDPMGSLSLMLRGTSKPCDLALEYALSVRIDPNVVGELFFNLLSSLESGLAQNTWLYISREHGTKGDTWHSCLHAIIAHSLATVPPEREHRNGFLYTACSPQSWTLVPSARELACITALQVRAQRFHGRDAFDEDKYGYLLAGRTLNYFRDVQRARDLPAEVRSTFSSWALAIDRFFDSQPRLQPYICGPCIPELADEACRRTYLDLLSDHTDVIPGGIASAEARLTRHVLRVLHGEAYFQGLADVIPDSHPTEDDSGDAQHVPSEQAGPSTPPIVIEGGASVSE